MRFRRNKIFPPEAARYYIPPEIPYLFGKPVLTPSTRCRFEFHIYAAAFLSIRAGAANWNRNMNWPEYVSIWETARFNGSSRSERSATLWWSRVLELIKGSSFARRTVSVEFLYPEKIPGGILWKWSERWMRITAPCGTTSKKTILADDFP